MLRSAEEAARLLGTQFRALPLMNSGELESTFATIVDWNADGLLVFPSPISLFSRERIMEFALKRRLPSMSWIREFVQVGGLMSYGVNFNAQYRRGAVYVDKIMEGIKAAELPIEQPVSFELVIKSSTAMALGIEISGSLLVLADEVI